MTPETHTICSCSKQQDIYFSILTTTPSVQQALCLKEVTGDSSSTRAELPNGVKQPFSKHCLMMWIVMLCANCHQKQVIHRMLLQDWRNLRKVWMMHLDAGGTFLTRHYALIVWFPHELIDVATYCIRYSRVCELGNTGDKGPSHSRTEQKTPSLNHVSDQKWTLQLKKRWIP